MTTYIYVNQKLNVMRLKVSDLKPGYYVFGNKGNVWSDTAHIYESGKGNMCGTPALSSNWAKIEEVKHIGCPECLAKYNSQAWQNSNHIFTL